MRPFLPIYLTLFIHIQYSTEYNSIIPTELLTVSIFKEHVDGEFIFHLFFISAKFDHTEKSLQYLFFDDLTYTHTKVKFENITSTPNIDKLAQLIEEVIQNETTNKQLQMRVNSPVRPLIGTINQSNDDMTSEYVPAVQNIFELETMAKIFSPPLTSVEWARFHIYHNYHSYSSDLYPKSLDTPTEHPVKFNLVLVIRSEKDPNNILKYPTLVPSCIYILGNSNAFLETSHAHFSFHFTKHSGIWMRNHIIEHQHDKIKRVPLTEEELNTGIIDKLTKVTSRDTAYKPDEKAVVVNRFVEADFYDAFKHVLGDSSESILNTILESKFKDLNNNVRKYVIQNKIEGSDKTKNYQLNLEVKSGFDKNKLATNLNPFDKETETKESITTSESTTIVSSSEQKEGNKTLLITILILLVVANLGVIGGYFLYKRKVERKKSFKKFREKSKK